MATIAFIGSGTMGEALATAAVKALEPGHVYVTDQAPGKAGDLAARLGCKCAATNAEAVHQADYVVMCVKPQFMAEALASVREAFQACIAGGGRKIIVSIVAGFESERYWQAIGCEAARLPVIRMLPNTACLIGEGFTMVMEDSCYTEADLAVLQNILQHSGGFATLPKSQFTAGTVLTSTSPAFIAMFASSLADAGVYNGLLRHQARRFALEGMLSTVKLLMSSDKHFEAMKDDVCSPLGPAIIGVKSLEDSGFRSSVMNAVIDAYRRFSDIS